MIAFEGKKLLDGSEERVPALKDWNWAPKVSDVGRLSRRIDGGITGTGVTFRNTFSQQVDSGETY